jgi:hypothetical protein
VWGGGWSGRAGAGAASAGAGAAGREARPAGIYRCHPAFRRAFCNTSHCAGASACPRPLVERCAIAGWRRRRFAASTAGARPSATRRACRCGSAGPPFPSAAWAPMPRLHPRSEPRPGRLASMWRRRSVTPPSPRTRRSTWRRASCGTATASSTPRCAPTYRLPCQASASVAGGEQPHRPAAACFPCCRRAHSKPPAAAAGPGGPGRLRGQRGRGEAGVRDRGAQRRGGLL